MSKQKTVLVVDDDKIILKEINRELRRNFFTTLTVLDGKAALEIIASTEIDIVLLDVKLPDLNGLEVLQKIKELQPLCEVIVITGYGTQEIAILSLRRGAIDYIEKPINIEELKIALGRALEKLSQNKNFTDKNNLLVLIKKETTAKHLIHFMRKEGFNVFYTGSGFEGLQIIENNKIDVLIVDTGINDISSIEVFQKAKKCYKDIEGILIAEPKNRESAVKSLLNGFFYYITRPINMDELLFSVNRAIERIKLYRQSLYRDREQKIISEIISKMNKKLERGIEEKAKELSQMQVQLFQTSKLATLGEMAAGLAHEMNQPLGSISLVSKHLHKLIEMDKLIDKDLEYGLIDIDSSVKRMTKIIQHIRTFARQDTLKYIKVNINETIDSALSLLGEQLRLHEIKVVKQLETAIPLILGEPYQLEQVWINLITNARDAVDEKEKLIREGKIENSSYNKGINIKTRFNSCSFFIEITISDNGVGMSSSLKEKIFEPFFTTKEVGKATGLGLSITYGIVNSHNGKIEVESQEIAGSKFIVSIPVEVENGQNTGD